MAQYTQCPTISVVHPPVHSLGHKVAFVVVFLLVWGHSVELSVLLTWFPQVHFLLGQKLPVSASVIQLMLSSPLVNNSSNIQLNF